MLAKMWTVAVAALIAGALALPAAHAQTAAAPAPKPAATAKPMAKKVHHKMDCLDYAYQSKEAADCMAKQGNKTKSAKPMKKASKKKTTS